MLTVMFPLLLATACGQEPGMAPDAAASLDDSLSSVPGRGLGNTQRQTVAMDVDEAGGVLGNSLPGSWGTFADGSPWNTPIAADASTSEGSRVVLALMTDQSSHIRFSREYTIPVWVVDSSRMPFTLVQSDRIFDWWDTDRDGWSDVGVPLHRSMWWEPTSDGHICVIDPVLELAWEMSRFDWPAGSHPTCTTFNIWDLSGTGYGDPDQGHRWQTRGGRGSGFPIIAGLLRPEEVEAGEIRHALVFTFQSVRQASGGADMFIAPPACRADGKDVGEQFPIEGMCFQLDPALTERDFDSWGLTPEARVVARALQTYGMYLGDRGGNWAVQVQLLSENPAEHRARWEERLPGLYRAIERIPTAAFRIVDRGGEVVVKS